MAIQNYLVIARPRGGIGHTINDLKIVDAFAIQSEKPLSNKGAAEHYMKMTTPAERRAKGHDDMLFECVPHGKWTF